MGSYLKWLIDILEVYIQINSLYFTHAHKLITRKTVRKGGSLQLLVGSTQYHVYSWLSFLEFILVYFKRLICHKKGHTMFVIYLTMCLGIFTLTLEYGKFKLNIVCLFIWFLPYLTKASICKVSCKDVFFKFDICHLITSSKRYLLYRFFFRSRRRTL